MTEKDIKLLWGRSGNRCAICKQELAQDAVAGGSYYTLGEQAHIIGESQIAARGDSILFDREREGYHNRILLCPTDHTKIDSDVMAWPTESLYQTKSKHELWVQETLGKAENIKLLAKQVAVSSIIDSTVKLCRLEEWKIWTSFVLAPDPEWEADFPNMLFEFRQIVEAAIWPDDFDELKRATRLLSILVHDAASMFLKHVDFRHGKYYAYKFYKAGGFNPNYARDVELYETWLEACTELIHQSTKAANWFADVVRRDINPMFFAERGKFMIVEGPYSDLKFYGRLLEFTAEEKAVLPDSLEKDKQ